MGWSPASEGIGVTGNVLRPILFLLYHLLCVGLFGDDCIIYRGIGSAECGKLPEADLGTLKQCVGGGVDDVLSQTN